MNASDTWKADQIYIVHGSLTVSSTATLTVQHGAVVKFDSSNSSSTYLQVDGKLNVQGTASDPVYFTSIWDDTVGGDANDDATTTGPGLGNWGAIVLDKGSTSTISNAVIRYGGTHVAGTASFSDVFLSGGYLSATSTTFASSSNHGLQVGSGTAIVASGTFIGNDYGVFMDGVGNLTVTSSSFFNNTLAAGEIALQNGGSFTNSGNSASGNGTQNGFLMQGSTGATSLTWGQDSIAYILSAVTINAGTTITMNPGTVMKSSNVLPLTVDGKLVIAGTSANPVYFTAINDDSILGDTNNDGVSTGTPGKWGSIVLDTGSTSTIKNAIIRYGGQSAAWTANIYLNGGYLSVTSTVIASSTNYGLRIASGTLIITTSTISSNLSTGFSAQDAGNLTITSSSFVGNSGSGVGYITYTSGVMVTSSGNTATNNALNGFSVGGQLVTNQTWTNDLPYIVNSVTVSTTKTLTINPGTIAKFASQANLTVDGTLNVKGTTSTNMIYFTSIKDDSVGGDTNNDGTSSSAAPGNWGWIITDPGSSSTMNYAVVRYGGSSGTSTVYMTGGKLTAWHDTIASSSAYGIAVGGGTLTIASSTLQGDGFTTTLAIENTTNVTSSATAKQNWWSSSTGPYNATGHSTGTTDGVGDYVNFIPWLTSKPL